MPRWVLLLIAGAVLATLLCTMFASAEEDAVADDAGADSGADAGADSGVAGGDEGEAAAQEFPVMVVHKDVSAGDTVPGTPVTVTVTVINIGSASAFNVAMSDKAPFEGDQSAAADELEPGMNLTHSYTVTPKSIGHTALPQAEATYTLAKDAAEKFKATSNEVREEVRDEKVQPTMEVGERGFINVVTPEEFERMHSTHWKEYVIYAIFCAIAIGMPYSQGRKKTREIAVLLREARKHK